MSYELVSNIGFKKSEGKITISSYCSNVSPKTIETWEFAKDETLDKKIEDTIRYIIGGSLKLSKSCDCVFTRAYAFAIKDVAKEEGLSLKKFFDDIMKVVWYHAEFDDPKDAPNDKTYDRFNRVCAKTKYYLFNKKEIKDTYVAYNFKESQQILHYSIFGM